MHVNALNNLLKTMAKAGLVKGEVCGSVFCADVLRLGERYIASDMGSGERERGGGDD